MKTLKHMTLATALILTIALPSWAQARQGRQGGDARGAVQDCPLEQQGTPSQDRIRQNPGTCDPQNPGQRLGRGGADRGAGRQIGGRGQGQRGQGAGVCLTEEVVPLTDLEVVYVLAMREEEKLARDVYLSLNNAFPSLIFVRIAASEQRHMNAVGRIITVQGMDDPVVNNGIGEFTDPAFTELYASLVTDGSVDYISALKVGALIEEIDIADLAEALEVVTNPQVKRVFENLLYGSYNHLRAFTTALAAEGVEYVPEVLDVEVYEEILNSAPVKGRGARSRQGQCTDPQGQCTAPQSGQNRTARQGR